MSRALQDYGLAKDFIEDFIEADYYFDLAGQLFFSAHMARPLDMQGN